MREFIYIVNGTEFIDTEAFGKAWSDAKALATEEKTYITRVVVNGITIHYEFYAKGGCFLDEKFFNKDRVKIF